MISHYCVMVASLIMLFTTLVLTPLSSGLLDDDIIPFLLDHNTTFSLLPWLDPSMNSSTAEQLSASFAYQAYSYAWLNGSLPAFTTPKYALAPWAPAPGTQNETRRETWTGSTMLFEAHLECYEAESTPVSIDGVGTVGYFLTSPDGRAYNGIWDRQSINMNPEWIDALAEDDPRMSWSVKRWDEFFSPDTTWNSLDMDTGGDGAQNTRLFVWASALGGNPLPGDWTAIFCSPKYYMEPVNATVLMPSGTVQSISRGSVSERAANRIDISDSPVLADLFPKLVNNSLGLEDKYIDDAGRRSGFGYPPQLLPHMESQLLRRFGERDEIGVLLGAHETGSKSTISVRHASRGITSFALYTQYNETLPDLLQPDSLAEMYQEAFKLLFSMVCTDALLNRFSEEVPTTVVRRLEVRGYTVNVLWCRFGQAGLGIVAFLTIALTFLGWGRKCNLDGEPNSIATSLGLLQRSPGMVKQLQNAEFHPPQVIADTIVRSGQRYRITLVEGEGPKLEILKDTAELRRKLPGGSKAYRAGTGWPTSSISGLLLVMLFATMLVLLVMVYSSARVNNGALIGPNSTGEDMKRQNGRHKDGYTSSAPVVGALLKMGKSLSRPSPMPSTHEIY